MRRRTNPAALIMALVTHPAAANTTFNVTRAGENVVCADLTKDESPVVASWIMGFWSGMNTRANADVGQSTTAHGILGEVKLYCSQHPSAGLYDATLATYETFAKAKK